MPKKLLPVLWTPLSLLNAQSIVRYLKKEHSLKEVESFFSILNSFETNISKFPKLYPKASKKNIRRAVIHEHVSVFYRTLKSKIEVLAIIDNRCDLSKWIS